MTISLALGQISLPSAPIFIRDFHLSSFEDDCPAVEPDFTPAGGPGTFLFGTSFEVDLDFFAAVWPWLVPTLDADLLG